MTERANGTAPPLAAQVAPVPSVEERQIIRAILACFFLSGATGLVYEVIWTRMLGLVFGHTVYAVSTVLAAFMGGLAAGSILFGRLADRSHHPIRLYGLLEGGIGLYCLATPALLRGVEGVYLTLHRRLDFSPSAFSLTQFLLAFGILLVPTTLMGGTLPILSRFLVRESETLGRRVGGLYALNTFGAVAGAYAAGFHLLPVFGIQRSLWLVVTLNLGIGVLAIVFDRRLERLQVRGAASALERTDASAPSLPGSPLPRPVAVLVLTLFGISGGVSMIYEVGWTRALSLVVGSSTYAFSTMLVAFLVGLAAGSALFARWWGDRVLPAWSFALLQLGIGATAAVVLPYFDRLPDLFLMAFRVTRDSRVIILAQFLVSGLAMLLPTLLMGATFPCAVRLLARGAGSVGMDVGRVYAVNTLGAILGTIAAGFVLIPVWGLQHSLTAASLLNLLGAAALGLASLRESRRAFPLAVAGLAAAGVALLPAIPTWDRNVMASGVVVYGPQYAAGGQGGRLRDLAPADVELLFYRDGLGATVSVHRRGDERSLRVNGKTDASTGQDMHTQLMLGHLPLLLHPAPRKVLVIGLGSGVTAAAVAQHPVEAVDVVEIEPAVVEAATFFARENREVLRNPRVRVHIADGRNFLLTRTAPLDVIISEPSNPWMSGIGNLYALDFYAMAARRLQPDGLFVQWIHAYQLDIEDLRMVVATFRQVFPHVSLWSGTTGDFLLVGSRRPVSVDPARLRRRTDSSPGIRQDLDRLGMSDPLAILADFVLAEPDLARFSEGGLLNTDDLPLLEFSAPFSMYRDTSALTMRVLDRFRTSRFPPLYPGSDPVVLNVPSFRYQLAVALEKKGHLPEAQRFLDDALAADPRHVPSLILRGQVLRRLGFPLRAEADFLRAAQLDPRDAGPYGQLGRLYAQQGLPDRAGDAFRRMQVLAPGAAEPHLLLARLHLEARRWEKAAAEAGRATALAPRELAAWDLLAQAHAGAGAWQEARAALRQGLALAPRHPGMLEQFGQVTLQLGERDEAARALRAALTVNPRALQARLSLARLYREAGEKKRGFEELQMAVRLHPSSPEALDEYERALANLEAPVTRQGQ